LALPLTCAKIQSTKKAQATAGKELAMDKDGSSAREAMDMPAHERTYKNFTGFVKLSTAFVAVVLIGMAIFLT
jgi:hypothetical protein